MSQSIPASKIKKIVFACDAGMGSSLIGANQLKKNLQQADLNIEVEHCSVRAIPDDAQIVIVQKNLAGQVRKNVSGAIVMPFDNFLHNPLYDRLIQKLKANENIESVE